MYEYWLARCLSGHKLRIQPVVPVVCCYYCCLLFPYFASCRSPLSFGIFSQRLSQGSNQHCLSKYGRTQKSHTTWRWFKKSPFWTRLHPLGKQYHLLLLLLRTSNTHSKKDTGKRRSPHTFNRRNGRTTEPGQAPEETQNGPAPRKRHSLRARRNNGVDNLGTNGKKKDGTSKGYSSLILALPCFPGPGNARVQRSPAFGANGVG